VRTDIALQAEESRLKLHGLLLNKYLNLPAVYGRFSAVARRDVRRRRRLKY
jgi:hypothetical protein